MDNAQAPIKFIAGYDLNSEWCEVHLAGCSHKLPKVGDFHTVRTGKHAGARLFEVLVTNQQALCDEVAGDFVGETLERLEDTFVSFGAVLADCARPAYDALPWSFDAPVADVDPIELAELNEPAPVPAGVDIIALVTALVAERDDLAAQVDSLVEQVAETNLALIDARQCRDEADARANALETQRAASAKDWHARLCVAQQAASDLEAERDEADARANALAVERDYYLALADQVLVAVRSALAG
jgi:hypothetical protein